MRRHRPSRYSLQRPQVRIFRCPVCGTLNPATKYKGRTNPGHIKTMWCYHCKAETDQEQID